MVGLRDEVDTVLDALQSVRHGDTTFNASKEGLVVFRISDPTVLWGASPRSATHGADPWPFGPGRRHHHCPLLKITSSSNPSSRMTFRTTVSCGSQVATMT